MSQITELVKEARTTAVEKGFYDDSFNVGEKLMLIVSELGEALEAARKDKYSPVGAVDSVMDWWNDENFVEAFKDEIKDSFEDELADAVIRIFDLAGRLNIPIEKHILAKMRYNKTRPYKHGKKF